MTRKLGYPGVVLFALACMLLLGPEGTEAATRSYIDYDRHTSQKALSAGKERGVVVRNGAVRLARGKASGTLTSKAYKPSTRFDTLVPSWNAATPGPTWLQVEVRVKSGGNWSRWFNLGVWNREATPVKRRSVDGQSTSRWRVATDTLQSKGRVFASAYQYRVRLSTKKRGKSPSLGAVSIVTSDSYRHGNSAGVPALKKAWGKDLRVPARTQMIYSQGEAWCSPTSLSMVMAYWSNRTGRKGLDQWPTNVARGVRDYGIPANSFAWGNWPFNTAYAASNGLSARVTRMAQIEQLERWTDRGIPVIVSIAWDNGYTSRRLSGAPLRRSNGHILVVRGFTKSGHVIVNDPAFGSSSKVRHVYRRNEFERAWLKNHAVYGNYGNSGITYLIHPKDKSTPSRYAARGSW
jgi:hypothetical protein